MLSSRFSVMPITGNELAGDLHRDRDHQFVLFFEARDHRTLQLLPVEANHDLVAGNVAGNDVETLAARPVEERALVGRAALGEGRVHRLREHADPA